MSPINGNAIFSKPVQPPNAELPILVTLSGIVILVRLLHPENALSPIPVTPSGIVMLVSLAQLLKAPSEISLTLSGIVIVFIFVSANASIPIYEIPFSKSILSIPECANVLPSQSVILEGMSICFSDVHSSKTCIPMVVRVSGNVTSESLVHWLKAKFPIEVNP